MKKILSFVTISIVAVTAVEVSKQSTQQLELVLVEIESKEAAAIEWSPGNFSRDALIPDGIVRSIQASIGLKGRALGHEGQKVVLDDGNIAAGAYHIFSDGGGVVAKADETGYYYMCNSETGIYPPWFHPDTDRSLYKPWLTGGTYALEFNNDHEFLGYEQRLGLTARNCLGGVTDWGSFISCEEIWQWGRCWQIDPEGIIDPVPTNVTSFYGLPFYGLWEAFVWYDGHAYVTDDDFYDAEEFGERVSWCGALVRFTPDAAGMACYEKVEKRDRWCTLDSGTHDYLKLNPDPDNPNNGGTYEWVSDIRDATPGLYAGTEGLDAGDGTLVFVAKNEKIIFFLDLETNVYRQDICLPDGVEPDNIRIFGDYVWICTEGPGLYVRRKGVTEEKFGNAKAVLLAPASGQQTAGIDFSPDGTRFYLNFYGGGTWQFWRDDGQSFELVPGV